MSSSDKRRAARAAAVAAEAATRPAAVTGSENAAADGAEPDPWFSPGPKVPGEADSLEPGEGADNSPGTGAEWFLPTGRAALMPESMTISADEDQPEVPRAEYPAQRQAAGAPPWAGDATGLAAGAPPWETGPWPGPGEGRASIVADAPGPDGSAPASPVPASAPWPPGAVLASGLVPLVIPGLVAGAVSLRRSKPGDPVRRASLLAIVASLAWAVIIVVVVASTSGGSAGSCQYPAAVHQAYAKAMNDLRSNAQASVTVADLGQAATRANASAAATATGDISVRSALFAMTADLQQARADIVAKRPVPGSLRAHLTADETALTASCPS